MARINVNSPSKIPKEPHWAIIRFSSITIPGDERSRTNPGHGYPESTETMINYIAFTDKEEWEKEVKRKMEFTKYSTDFIAVQINPAKITTSVSVEIK